MAATSAKVILGGTGATSVRTGVPLLDDLVVLLAAAGRFDIELTVEPDEPEAEVDASGLALGRALVQHLRAPGARGHGLGAMPADEALATIVVETSDRPLVVSNVDLAPSHPGGLDIDVAGSFVHGLAEAGGLTIHVRLIEGEDSQHVLAAIFKALGVALADACAIV